MEHEEQAPEALLELASILVAEQSLEETLAHVLQLACSSITGAHMGGVTLLEREGPVTAVATDEEARQVDDLQYQAVSGGPCLEAYRRQRVFRIESTESEERWPEFCRNAADAGVMSSLSLPLVVAGDGIGALNIYCRQPNGFTAEDEAKGALFASHASVALANARMYWKTKALAAQLEEALSSRGVIEQAKGILMAHRGCTADEAFAMLVQASQRSHTKLREVANQLVERARAQAVKPPRQPE